METYPLCGWQVYWCVPNVVIVGEGVIVGLRNWEGVGGDVYLFQMSKDW